MALFRLLERLVFWCRILVCRWFLLARILFLSAGLKLHHEPRKDWKVSLETMRGSENKRDKVEIYTLTITPFTLPKFNSVPYLSLSYGFSRLSMSPLLGKSSFAGCF